MPEVPKEEQSPKKVAPTPEQIIAIQAAIENSQTLEEVARLEQALKSGQLPAELEISDNDAITNNGNTKEDKMVTDDEKNLRMMVMPIMNRRMVILHKWRRSSRLLYKLFAQQLWMVRIAMCGPLPLVP